MYIVMYAAAVSDPFLVIFVLFPIVSSIKPYQNSQFTIVKQLFSYIFLCKKAIFGLFPIQKYYFRIVSCMFLYVSYISIMYSYMFLRGSYVFHMSVLHFLMSSGISIMTYQAIMGPFIDFKTFNNSSRNPEINFILPYKTL